MINSQNKKLLNDPTAIKKNRVSMYEHSIL